MLVWLAALLVLGIVVFVHELGHFLAAKALGVYAPRFSIGFGPAIFRRRVGETEYQLALLPLGGFVRMASREDEDLALLEGGSESAAAKRAHVHLAGANDAPPVAGSDTPSRELPKDWDPDAMIPFGPREIPPHRFFESKPLWARLIILLAGVTMNIILAFVMSVASFVAYGTPAPQRAVVDSVVAGEPAARAGMQAGDSIVAIDGSNVKGWGDVTERIAAAAGRELVFVVDRHGARETLRVTPASANAEDPETGKSRRIGRIGVAVRPTLEREKVGLGDAVSGGWRVTWLYAGMVTDVLHGLVTRQVSVSNLGGPIAIARASADAARQGLETLLRLIVFLSVNLAVFNLLPIPILDGGQIVMQVAESVKGKPFSDRTREYIARAGLLVILLLFVVVMRNDITRLWKDLVR